MAEDRRIQDIDRFVVETFEDRTRKVLVRVNDRGVTGPGSPVGNASTTDPDRCSSESVTRVIVVDNELRAEGRHDVAHVDVPPIRA